MSDLLKKLEGIREYFDRPRNRETLTFAISALEVQRDRIAELEAQLAAVPEPNRIAFERVTGPGQVQEGDLLLMIVSTQRQMKVVKAHKVLRLGAAEEVVYNIKKNHYFLTDLIGQQWHKEVYLLRYAGGA
jgi:hypothetical protein